MNSPQSIKYIVRFPLVIKSEMNQRGRWQGRHFRFKAQKQTVALNLLAAGWPRKICGPTTITLCRIASRKLDGDNLAGGFKAVRDCVAAHLGIDDGSELLTWRYEQKKGKTPEVEISMQPIGTVRIGSPSSNHLAI